MNKRRIISLIACLGTLTLLQVLGNGCSHSSITTVPVSATAVSFYPPGGPLGGGNPLTFTGAVFDGHLSIQVGGQNCPISSFSTTSVSCTVPAAVASWANVLISIPGQPPISLTQTYAYGLNVIGQPDYVTSVLNYTNSLSHPSFALENDTQLLISDSQAARVTLYAPTPTTSSATPTSVLGQNGISGGPIPFTVPNAYGLGMSNPKGMCTDGTRVMILDSGRNRLLIYSGAPAGPTSPPSFVLGQTTMVGQQANQGSATLNASMLNNPQGLYCDSTNIIISDSGNNRVLIWNQAVTVNGQLANIVLGQADFTGGAANQGGSASASTLSNPRGVIYDSTLPALFVADQGNHRVLVWSSVLTGLAPTASFVLGQTNFTNTTAGGCTQTGFGNPEGLASVGSFLYISDSAYNRILALSTTVGLSTWANNQAANLVFGQSNYTSCQSNMGAGPVTALSLREPTGLSSNYSSLSTNNTKLYIADTGNNRVLVYNTAPTANPAPTPDLYFGQSSPSGVNPAYSLLSPAALRSPQSASFFGTALYVADADLNRVLMYTPAPTLPATQAIYVLGQPDMLTGIANSITATLSAQTLSTPKSVYVDGAQNLYVADSGNNRVLVFSGAPLANQPAATDVIGQTTMTSAAATLTAAGLKGVSQVCETNGQLIAADPGNNRVLVYNAWNPASSPGQSATYVLGQSNMTSNAANMGGAATATSLSAPTWIACSPTQLVVSDVGNQRILIYTLPVAGNTPSATLVLGQPDFVSTQANQGLATGANAASLYSPHGVAMDGSKLYVADSHNNRILIWHKFPTANGQAADAIFGQTSMSAVYPNAGGATPGILTLNGPAGLSVGNGLLVIADTSNSRVLVVPEP